MSEIKKIKRLFDRYIDLNKRIVKLQSIVVVPSKRIGGMPVNDIDIEEDFVYFCFAKFTKTMNSINVLIKEKLYEDALILLRSNFECFINAKAVVVSSECLDSFIEYKLGLIDGKKYKKKNGRSDRIRNVNTGEEFEYIDRIYDIAQKANETDSYRYLYKYLCEITHCNFITSGYYRDGVVYSYEKVNEVALYNVLLWSVYLNYKFYNCLIEDEIFDIDELKDEVEDVLSKDFIVLLGTFDKVISDIKKIDSNDENVEKLEILKRNLLEFLDE